MTPFQALSLYEGAMVSWDKYLELLGYTDEQRRMIARAMVGQ